MQPPSTSPLWSFFFYCYCFLTVSLAFLFHVCPVYSLLSFSSAVSLELFCTTSFISSRLSLISWFTHNVTTTPPKTQHYNIYWHPHSARNLQVQQVLQPVDPQAIPGLVRTHLDSKGDKDGQVASPSQPSELTQPSSTGNPPRGAKHLGFGLCRASPELQASQGYLRISVSHFTIVAAAVLFVCLRLRQEEPPPPTNPPVVFNHLWFCTFFVKLLFTPLECLILCSVF